MIANGVDFKPSAKILGNDVKETLKTYSHVNDDMMEIASQVIKNIFWRNFDVYLKELVF